MQCLLTLTQKCIEPTDQATDFLDAVRKLHVTHRSKNISLCFQGLRDLSEIFIFCTFYGLFVVLCHNL